jgi:plastocyanin
MGLSEQILEFVGGLVSPDWNALVLLIPLGLVPIVVLYLLWTVRRFTTTGPAVTRRLPEPRPPAGVHLPGPSFSPLLVAVGAGIFVVATLALQVQPVIDPATGQPTPDAALVVIDQVGMAILLLGFVALAAALLYWGREAIRDYDALERPHALVAVERTGPPPGVHIPGPSFRPLVVSVATGVLLFGLAVHPAIFAGGLIMTVIALLGWLQDARREYPGIVEAAEPGNEQSHPGPRFPTRTLLAFAIIFAGSLLFAGGVLPPADEPVPGNGVVAPTPTPPPVAATPTPPPAEATPTPAPDGEATPPPAAGVVLEISAQGIAFDTDTMTVPADTPFQIVFTNYDAGIPHNVEILQDGQSVWMGEIFAGVETRTYNVPALPAGTYQFRCTPHPVHMLGTLIVE